MTLGNAVHEVRQKLAGNLRNYSCFDAIAAQFLLLLLVPFSAPLRIRKELSPQENQKISSMGSDGVQRDLLIASRKAVTPGRYLVRSDHECWQWVNVVAVDGTWRHELLGEKPERRDIAGELAMVVVGLATLATITLIVFTRFTE